ncbi:hypothetical protein HAX54_046903 [Datura stramonium]|uniref:Uncharacterized protein n=1 Tax=Datura stramonium TaxID=4076 RepID=A0ABS8WLF3_DATST|nr:hypothetical protein [Datura stramonium]
MSSEVPQHNHAQPPTTVEALILDHPQRSYPSTKAPTTIFISPKRGTTSTSRASCGISVHLTRENFANMAVSIERKESREARVITRYRCAEPYEKHHRCQSLMFNPRQAPMNRNNIVGAVPTSKTCRT